MYVRLRGRGRGEEKLIKNLPSDNEAPKMNIIAFSSKLLVKQNIFGCVLF